MFKLMIDLDPDIGSLFAVKCLRLAVDDHTTFLDDDLGGEGLGAVLASSPYYRAHPLTDLVLVVLVVLSYRVRCVSYLRYDRKLQKYDAVVPRGSKRVKMGRKWYDIDLKES
jgi:hypothetical protein